VNVRLKAISSGQSILTSPATRGRALRPTLSTRLGACDQHLLRIAAPQRTGAAEWSKSMIATVQPAARDRIAATIAAVPVPTITRSYSLVLTFLQRLRPGGRADQDPCESVWSASSKLDSSESGFAGPRS